MNHSPEILSTLANDMRWRLIQVLLLSDHRVSELVTITGQPKNLVFYHLKALRKMGIVSTRRSDADRRDTYYSLNWKRLQALLDEVGLALRPTGPQRDDLRILFVCTHNNARSQMAQGIMHHLSNGTVHVCSAGCQPTQIHPDAIRTMDNLNIDIRSQFSQGFKAVGDVPFDYVISLCDKARNACTKYRSDGVKLHWGYADPTAIFDPTERAAAFESLAHHLYDRIQAFLGQS